MVPVAGRSRTNVFHLPVKGSGDGGIYSTAADITALWQSLFAGRIVPARWGRHGAPRGDVPAESKRYGLGFWLGQHSDTVILEGFDAGVSFRSVHDQRSALTCTVMSNRDLFDSNAGVPPGLEPSDADQQHVTR